jgi:hypothetical protein
MFEKALMLMGKQVVSAFLFEKNCRFPQFRIYSLVGSA